MRFPRHGLRFDKVAIRLVTRLREALTPDVPAGTSVIVTVTAPIRLAAKTTTGLEEKIRALLARRSARDTKATVHGNRVRIRIVRGRPRRAPKLIGFVHNPDVDPVMLLSLASEDRVRRPASSRIARRSRR